MGDCPSILIIPTFLFMTISVDVVSTGVAAEPIRRIPMAIARRFTQVCTSAAAEAVEGAGLTPLEFALMAYVNPIDGEPDVDQSSLAGRLGVDRNTVSMLVASLAAKGLIEQRVPASDRRARLVRLTPEGEAHFAELHPTAIARQQDVLAALSPEEADTLMALLIRVIETNPEWDRPGAGRRPRRTYTSA